MRKGNVCALQREFENDNFAKLILIEKNMKLVENRKMQDLGQLNWVSWKILHIRCSLFMLLQYDTPVVLVYYCHKFYRSSIIYLHIRGQGSFRK